MPLNGFAIKAETCGWCATFKSHNVGASNCNPRQPLWALVSHSNAKFMQKCSHSPPVASLTIVSNVKNTQSVSFILQFTYQKTWLDIQLCWNIHFEPWLSLWGLSAGGGRSETFCLIYLHFIALNILTRFTMLKLLSREQLKASNCFQGPQASAWCTVYETFNRQ